MRDITTKTDGSSTLSAAEFNEIPGELENAITSSGQTLSSGDLNQLGKALGGYAAVGDFYTDSGSANAYILTATTTYKAPTAYITGMKVRFRPGNTNTTASTVNVATLGVKSIKNRAGSADPVANDLLAGADIDLVYDGTNFRAMVVVAAGVGTIVQTVSIYDQTPTSTASNIPCDNTIPQNTEGAQLLSLAITPTSASNLLLIEFIGSQGAADVQTVALFQDSTANALAAGQGGYIFSGVSSTTHVTHRMTAGTTSATTFKIRYGANTDPGYANQEGGGTGDSLGSRLGSILKITEIKA